MAATPSFFQNLNTNSVKSKASKHVRFDETNMAENESSIFDIKKKFAFDVDESTGSGHESFVRRAQLPSSSNAATATAMHNENPYPRIFRESVASTSLQFKNENNSIVQLSKDDDISEFNFDVPSTSLSDFDVNRSSYLNMNTVPQQLSLSQQNQRFSLTMRKGKRYSLDLGRFDRFDNQSFSAVNSSQSMTVSVGLSDNDVDYKSLFSEFGDVVKIDAVNGRYDVTYASQQDVDRILVWNGSSFSFEGKDIIINANLVSGIPTMLPKPRSNVIALTKPGPNDIFIQFNRTRIMIRRILSWLFDI